MAREPSALWNVSAIQPPARRFATREDLAVTRRIRATPGTMLVTSSLRSTFEAPYQLATGVRWLLVNGTVVVDDGHHTG